MCIYIAVKWENYLQLRISVRPKCAIGLKTEYLAYKHQMVKIECQVMANPSNNIIFEWTFNDTAPDYVQKVSFVTKYLFLISSYLASANGAKLLQIY